MFRIAILSIFVLLGGCRVTQVAQTTVNLCAENCATKARACGNTASCEVKRIKCDNKCPKDN